MKLHQVEVGREHIFHGACGPAIVRVAQVRPDGWIKVVAPVMSDMGQYVVVEDWVNVGDLEPVTAGADEEDIPLATISAGPTSGA